MKRMKDCLQPAGPVANHADPARPARLRTPMGDCPPDCDGEALASIARDTPPELSPGRELGRCRLSETWLSVHFHDARAMWLCRDGDLGDAVGVLRWDMGKSPQLVLNPREGRFVRAHEPEVVAMVDLAMAIWWCVVDGLPLDPRLPLAIHPEFAKSVVYWSRSSRSDLHGPAQPTTPDSRRNS